MTRTMIETDAKAATAACEEGSRPTRPQNARGTGRLPLTDRVEALARRAHAMRAGNGSTNRAQMMLIEDALALVHDLADQVERITPYLDETAQGDDDDLQPGGTA
jgi:hypothetical protein